jgi:methyl-accepting chemotaxis protein
MKWKVGTKIGMGFGLALAIIAIIGAASFRSAGKLIENAEMVSHTHEVREKLSALMQSLTDAETGQRGYIISQAESYLEPYYAGSKVTEAYIKDLRDLTRDNPRQQRRLDVVQSLARSRLTSLAEVLRLQKSKGSEPAREDILTGKGKAEMDNLRKAIGEMRDEENALLRERTDEAQTSVRNTKLTILTGSGCALIVLALAGFLISRNIVKPLQQITSTAERIAVGDLRVEVATNHRRDEVGMLAHAFGRMTQSLRDVASVAAKIAEGDLRVSVRPQSEYDVLGNAFASMIANLQRLTSQITEGINVLSSSASQISTSTTQMASSAAETATSVSQTTTTVEEVRQTAQLSSQKAKIVAETSQRTAQISQAGTKSTELTIAGMSRIRQQMDTIADSMVRLSEQSQTIGQIVATVEDLAAQSNLLAVNASIEAAKAGEHGKGFAVVAQEVRSLAEQSKQATSQVRSILSDIQKATGAAVMATEQGSKAVEAGVKQSGEAGESIQNLSSNVSEAAQVAVQIAASSQQQLVGVGQVASAMENIKQASTQNVATAKQLEAAAHNLKDLGTKLKRTVDTYKV